MTDEEKKKQADEEKTKTGEQNKTKTDEEKTKTGEQNKTKTVKIEVLQPVTHGFVEFSRGVHELSKEMADAFLKLKDAVTGKPIARLPQTKEILAGTTSEAADSPKRLGGVERRQ